MKTLISIGMPLILGLLACQKPTIVLRDPEVYRNEIAFLQMALEQDTELLKAHLADGSCTCTDGAWVTEVCETSALNVLVIQYRLQYHVDLMLYNAKMIQERPPTEPPEVPDPSTLCPPAAPGDGE
jgi:hypothetical protein